MSNSNSKRARRKPAKDKPVVDRPPKPRPDFPLCAGGNGYWLKKINGEIKYFGRWGKVVNKQLVRIREDGCWQEAETLYKQSLNGEQSADDAKDELTVGRLCNSFLTSKLLLMQSGEITARTFAEYRATTDRLVARFGKRAVDSLEGTDFERLRAEIAKQWGPVRLGNEITRVKTVFKYGRKSDLVPREFKKPSKGVLRKHRATKSKKLFEAAEIRALLDAASVQMKAMILLGINAGLGNDDGGTLTLSVVALEGGWIAYARRKTGIERRCPLWPETVEALKKAIAERTEPKDAADADLIFVTKYGKGWTRLVASVDEKGMPKSKVFDSISPEFHKLFDKAKVDHNGRGFYALRHTFRTIADASKDGPAIRHIMGHTDGSIDDVYRESIEDSRLRAVADYVRAWLSPESPVEKGGAS